MPFVFQHSLALLDLLSLVSDSCAERVRRQMGFTPKEAAERRRAFAAELRGRTAQ